MRDRIWNFCAYYQFSSEASEALLLAYDKLSANPEAFGTFCRQSDLYEQDGLLDYDGTLASLDAAAELCGIHKYVLHLLFYMCLVPHARALYEQKGIALSIWKDSMEDLKWKMIDCHLRFDIWGISCGLWIAGFFQLTRFALGRLQFELIPYGSHYKKGDNELKPEDLVINIHITSSGPLRHEDCLEAYRRAAVFFTDSFQDRPTAFVCYSWLLFPANRHILQETSNIRKFMDDFDITESETDDGKDLWRIFFRDYTGDPEQWPSQTSLQRAYIAWLKAGNRPGSGRGVFFYDLDRGIL